MSDYREMTYQAYVSATIYGRPRPMRMTPMRWRYCARKLWLAARCAKNLAMHERARALGREAFNCATLGIKP